MSHSVAGANSGDGKIYYGWIIVATSFTLQAVSSSIQYSFGVFFKPLQDTFGWSRATTSWAMTAHLVVFALCMVPLGWAIDRFNTRTLYSIAALLVGFALVFSSRISQPWQLYLLYGLPLAMGLSICGPAILTIVTRWFTEKRGLALGITSAGVGFGTLGGAPLSNSLIAAYGWRDAYVILGIASCVIFLVCAYFMKGPPRQPVGGGNSAAIKSQNNSEALKSLSVPSMTFSEAIKTRAILLIMLANAATNFTVRMIMVHIAPDATDVGISPSVAALAIGAIGGFSVLGRLIMGFAQDKIGPQRSMVICMIIQGFSMLALPFIRSDLWFFAYAVVFGFTYGGDIPQMPAITAQFFGLAAMNIIYGLVATVGSLGGALGPIIAGYVFDLTSSYTIVFFGAAVSLFAGVYCISRLRPRAS